MPDAPCAFLNVPFDKEYEPLFLALIAGLSGFGLVPKSVLEIPGSQRRLDRLTQLIANCEYSLHDISRVTLSDRVPRFNMPFELGLTIGMVQTRNLEHHWYVLESRPHRAQKSLSDLNGTEVYVHGARAVGVLQVLRNALGRSEHKPEMRELQAILRDLRRVAREILREPGVQTLYDTRPFQKLVYAANQSAIKRIPSLRKLTGARTSG